MGKVEDLSAKFELRGSNCEGSKFELRITKSEGRSYFSRKERKERRVFTPSHTTLALEESQATLRQESAEEREAKGEGRSSEGKGRLISAEDVAGVDFILYVVQNSIIAVLRHAQDVFAIINYFRLLLSLLSKSKSPAISASFLALDQPLTCLSRLNAS